MNQEAATANLKRVVSAHRTFTKWLAWCEGLSAARMAAKLFDKAEWNTAASIAVERVYEAVYKRPSMPSKDRKHQMYSDAYRAASLAGLDIAPGSISDMEGIAKVIAQVTAAIATA